MRRNVNLQVIRSFRKVWECRQRRLTRPNGASKQTVTAILLKSCSNQIMLDSLSWVIWFHLGLGFLLKLPDETGFSIATTGFLPYMICNWVCSVSLFPKDIYCNWYRISWPTQPWLSTDAQWTVSASCLSHSKLLLHEMRMLPRYLWCFFITSLVSLFSLVGDFPRVNLWFARQRIFPHNWSSVSLSSVETIFQKTAIKLLHSIFWDTAIDFTAINTGSAGCKFDESACIVFVIRSENMTNRQVIGRHGGLMPN